MKKTISELPVKKFEGEAINNCFHVEFGEQGNPISAVKMKNVFEYIKKKALEDEGLTVELTGEGIIFIKGRKNK